jgi:tRNA-specific 2-thiouridylase
MDRIKRAAVGLSGGVDSAVAAALLAEQGYEVVGITMKIWSGAIALPEGSKQACYGPDEAEDVAACKKLSKKLGIDYRSIDLTKEYETKVIDYFRCEYRAGRTPNPCIVCNSELKFGFLIERAQALGLEFDFFATGHYARVAFDARGRARLRAALDPAKDQSYFLYRLGPETLGRVLFPLGELRKAEVRGIARRLGLELADKPESQDFVAGGDYSPLFADRPPEIGDIVDSEGRILGRHRGLPYYTIGQRRGLGIGASPDGGGEAEALYVLALDPERNRVIVGPNRGLFAEGLLASDFRFYGPVGLAGTELATGASGTELAAAGTAPRESYRGLAKIRQNHRAVPCSFEPGKDGACLLRFDEAQRALAPGQSVVVYDEEGLVLGGGIIETALDSLP